MNNQMNFDPITGQPINNQNNTIPMGMEQQQSQVTVPVQPLPSSSQDLSTQLVQTSNENVTPFDNLNSEINQTITTVDNSIDTQQQLQSIPTVEQSTQNFINNVQSTNTEKQDEKKDRPNITFIIILFAIIFAAILFLFPFLLKTL
jgi:UDP-3-O-acyl-N-acetylglucosamine deacetylase